MADYQKVISSLKKRPNGATAADISSVTALPLSTVRELLPKAADEFSGHLRVTQSGEILYHFPNGFTSRFRGIGVFLKKAAGKIASFTKKALALLFKIWIMVMLIGYFILFLAIAVGSVFLSLASKSDNRGGRSDGNLGFGLFEIMFRLWFYSELTKPRYDNGYGRIRKNKKTNRPMHKAIFSFIFGEEDPNIDWEEQQMKDVIAFLQANNGVISLAEYMTFTGENSLDAEKSILSFCSKFEGSPEVTEDGTIVYRFDELLMRHDSRGLKKLSPGVKKLKKFSANSKVMNAAFAIINGFNLIFGSYFFYQATTARLLVTELQYQAASKIYAYTHYFANFLTAEPQVLIGVVLGIIPVVFSLFFWLIPSVRYFLEKKENNNIKLSNFKRFSFSRIWSSPIKVNTDNLYHPAEELNPKDLESARDRVIKEIGAVSNPEVETDETGKMIYSFNELEREKQAVKKYRASVDVSRLQIGKTIFDSNEKLPDL